MHSFHDLEITTLKKICSKYNLHVKIAKYSKLSKEQLIPHMEKHLHISENGKIKLKKEASDMVEDELSKMIEALKKKVKEVKEKVKKHHGKKETPKEEEKNINIEKKEEKMKAMTIKQVKEEAKKYDLQLTKKINGKSKSKTKKELLDEMKPKKEINIEEKKEPLKQKKTYDNYSQYNEEEKEFMNAIRDNNGIHRPDKIQRIYKEKFSNKNIEDFYIYRINISKNESLEQLKKSIEDKHSEHHLQVKIDDLNEKIKNNLNAFKTKQAQKKADERIEEWNKEKYPKEKELEKYNKIRDIQKENYKKLKDMKIETVKDADEYADLINASGYLELSHKLNAEEKPKEKKHNEELTDKEVEELRKEHKKNKEKEMPKEEQSSDEEELPEGKIKVPIEKQIQSLEYYIKFDENRIEEEERKLKRARSEAQKQKIINSINHYKEIGIKPKQEKIKELKKKLMMKEQPMNKIDKIESELHKLEQLIKMDEKVNEKEHKKLHEEVKQKKVFTDVKEYKDHLKKVYKKKALEYHPDKNIGNEDEAKKKFQNLKNQYDKKMKEVEKIEEQQPQKGQRRKRPTNSTKK